MKPPIIECEQIHPGFPVSDLAASLAFYTEKLGFQQSFVMGDFAGLNLGEVQMFLSKGVPTPPADMGIAYFVVSDADELYEFHTANGVEITAPIEDRHYGMRDYTVRDPDGYLLVFGRHAFDHGDPVPIERVDVPVRLEKRLAALLQDLAVRKRMSLSSCLEEILLHTNDGVTPHTQADLRYIEELKEKHGIDYDTHASYRFKEF